LIDVVEMGEEWGKLARKIGYLQSDLNPFRVDFLDRDSFKSFCDSLPAELQGYREICITGYFSETVREALQKIIRRKRNVRLICSYLDAKKHKDRKNLQVLRKLSNAGAEIKVNERLHARFLVAFNPDKGGFLIIGSFDFNTECIGKERYDAGIKTGHPDLVNSAIKFFEQIWKEPETISLEDFIQKKRT